MSSDLHCNGVNLRYLGFVFHEMRNSNRPIFKNQLGIPSFLIALSIKLRPISFFQSWQMFLLLWSLKPLLVQSKIKWTNNSDRECKISRCLLKRLIVPFWYIALFHFLAVRLRRSSQIASFNKIFRCYVRPDQKEPVWWDDFKVIFTQLSKIENLDENQRPFDRLLWLFQRWWRSYFSFFHWQNIF